jgi:fructose-bisphosphate aldolase class II
LSDQQFRKLIERGVSKINYFTALADAAADQIRSNLSAAETQGGYTALLKGIQAPMQAEMERCIRLWGSDNRAGELLEACQAWRPVDHLIIYNSSGDSDVEAMIAEGRAVLAAIPGVREVFAGEAVRDGAGYRYSWNIRFCHPDVIDSYRNHPDHVDFANNRFRPVAGDRISIDFRETRVAHAP